MVYDERVRNSPHDGPSIKPHGDTPPQGRRRLTTNQIRGFWAAWAGWASWDGDGFLYLCAGAGGLRCAIFSLASGDSGEMRLNTGFLWWAFASRFS